MYKIYQSNVETKITKELKYENNNWMINNYFDKNMFFIIEKKENKTHIINVAFCLENGNKMKLTETAKKLGLEFCNNMFRINNKLEYLVEDAVTSDGDELKEDMVEDAVTSDGDELKEDMVEDAVTSDGDELGEDLVEDAVTSDGDELKEDMVEDAVTSDGDELGEDLVEDRNRSSGNSISCKEDGSIMYNKNDDNAMYDMYNKNDFDSKDLEQIYKNIESFTNKIKNYKNILFICSDYPGYGGAATNCDKLQQFFSKSHKTFAIYYNFKNEQNINFEKNERYMVINEDKLSRVLKSNRLNPDVIILKNFVSINLKEIFNIPIIYLIAGIFTNKLDKYYYDIKDKVEYDKYINQSVLKQIKNSDYTFCNSSHTQEILKDIYGIETNLFYSSFVPYYNKQKQIEIDEKWIERVYDYGLIMSDFNRPIKNVEKSIEFLKDKDNVILIGKNSNQYKHHGFKCIDLVKSEDMRNYYKQIKYIVQNSFYESCSNVKVEAIMNGCKLISNIFYKGIIAILVNTSILNIYQYIALKYWINRGYEVYIYSYIKIINAPKECKIYNGAEILNINVNEVNNNIILFGFYLQLKIDCYYLMNFSIIKDDIHDLNNILIVKKDMNQLHDILLIKIRDKDVIRNIIKNKNSLLSIINNKLSKYYDIRDTIEKKSELIKILNNKKKSLTILFYLVL